MHPEQAQVTHLLGQFAGGQFTGLEPRRDVGAIQRRRNGGRCRGSPVPSSVNWKSMSYNPERGLGDRDILNSYLVSRNTPIDAGIGGY